MLPNRLNLYKSTEDELRRLKQRTGITPNVAARIAFCKSIDEGFRYTGDERKLDGTLSLDKATWFGDYIELYELLLIRAYPEFNGHQLERAWAAHVEAGLPACRFLRSLTEPIG